MKSLVVLLCMLLSVGAIAQNDTIYSKSGLKMVVLKKGEGATPAKKQRISVHYTGTFKDGTVFDSSIDKSPVKFRVGWGDVIPAWDEAFMKMNQGTKAWLYVPSKIGYGPKGFEHPYEDGRYLVPPNTDLYFEIELVDLK